ncbi:MAG: Asp-tRNA(Asn)/Glu-tRNA(Gln) amidotransferase subunit GatC [Candidatus Eisenbacteria bacterium]
MTISKAIVEHVARLCRLSVRPGEVERFQKELGRIIEYVDKLSEVDTSLVEPSSHGLEGTTPLREDVRGPGSLSREDVLQAAPASDRGHFKVPRVL